MGKEASLRDFLRAQVAKAAGLDPSRVAWSDPVYVYGVDSSRLMMIVEAAETAFGCSADLDRLSPAETLDAICALFAPAAVTHLGAKE